MDAAAGGGAPPGELWRHTAPYRGLHAMTESDADFFFGRGRETTEVIGALAATPDKLPVLLGNSGVGKSSLAQAGVIAALMRQAWPETAEAPGAWPPAFNASRRWCFLKLKPGTEPVRALVEPFLWTWQFDAIDPRRAELPVELGGQAARWEGRVARPSGRDRRRATATNCIKPEPPAFLIYIDQGEELYVRAEERERRRFSEILVQGLADPRLRAMMSLRADFFGDLQKDEPLYAAHRLINVPPLREAQLREVVSRPAAQLSARFEPEELAADIARRAAEESAKDAGALPLLSYLLDDMWTGMVKRGDGMLRLPKAAIELGAVLVERADAFLAAHPNSEDAAPAHLTLKLATVREDGEPTRRRALRSEFSDEEWRLVTELADHPNRLLVTATSEAGETYAEVAHEAIFRRWAEAARVDRCRARVSGLARPARIRPSALGGGADRSKHDALLMGLGLAEALSWLDKRGEDLPKHCREFVDLSLQREIQERAQRRRQQRNRIAFRLVAAAVLLLIAGGVLYGWDRFLREKSDYYRAIVWREGLPEGRGDLDAETRRQRDINFQFVTRAGKVRRVSRENSMGALRNNEDGVARWEIVYREDELPDRLKLFRQEGPLVREEVFKGRSKDVAIIDFEASSEGGSTPMAQATIHGSSEAGDGKSTITRHRLKFDEHGFTIEIRFLDHFGIPRRDAQGSFGRRFSYSAEGLVTRRAEIDRDGNEITLKTGLRAVIFSYDRQHYVAHSRDPVR